MNEIVQLISQNGIGIVCVAYLLYFNATTMKDITKTLESICNRLSIIETKIDEKEKD